MTIATFTTTMGNQEGVDNLNGVFDKNIGHAHDGTAMNGGIISYNDLKDKPTNMATADRLSTPRTINGVAFDGSENIVINGGLAAATFAEAIAGTSDISAITPLKLRNALNADGSAPIYACRAWVNFNGTGTVAIRASGNISSVVDNGTGDYTINFAVAMADLNYTPVVNAMRFSAGSYNDIVQPVTNGMSATSIRVRVSSATADFDSAMVSVAIFR